VCYMAKIVHFGKYYSPDVGGIESVTGSLAKAAVDAGHQVSVISFERTPAIRRSIIGGVYVTRAPVWKTLASQPIAFGYIFECVAAGTKADIVHLHAPNMLGALCALCLPKRVRLLVHWHSDVIDKGILAKLLRPLEFALLRRSNIIIATSQAYADSSARLARFKEKLTVVAIGATSVKDRGAHSPLPQELQEQVGGKKIILAVGRLVPYKGFDVLIAAAKSLEKDSVVVIVGGGPLKAELHQAVELGGVKDRVVMAGRLSDDALHALFARATLFCLPSIFRAEAFGVVLLEAMSYGLPIVASDIPGSGVPWVNQHGVSGLNVPVGNPKALAEACNLILGSPEVQAKFADGARQRFLAEFTEDVSASRMMGIYERLCAVSSGHP